MIFCKHNTTDFSALLFLSLEEKIGIPCNLKAEISNTDNSWVLSKKIPLVCTRTKRALERREMTASAGVSQEKTGFWWKVDKDR